MAELGDDDRARLLERPARRHRRPRPHRRAAAPGRRPRRGPRRDRGLRGAGLGPPRQPGRPGLGGRGRAPTTRPITLAVDTFHMLARGDDGVRPGRHPRRPDRLPPGRRRTAARHERARVEPPLPLLPGPGHPRRHRRRRGHPRGGLPRAAVARGLQRRGPRGRPGASPRTTRCAPCSSSRTSSPRSSPDRPRAGHAGVPAARPGRRPASSSWPPPPATTRRPACSPGSASRCTGGTGASRWSGGATATRTSCSTPARTTTPVRATALGIVAPAGRGGRRPRDVAAVARRRHHPRRGRGRAARHHQPVRACTSSSATHPAVRTTGSATSRSIGAANGRRAARHRPRRGRRRSRPAQRGGRVLPHPLRPLARARSRSSWSRTAGCAAARCGPPKGDLRVVLNCADTAPGHAHPVGVNQVAFACADVVATVAALRVARRTPDGGAGQLLRRPRRPVRAAGAFLDPLREHHLLYDRIGDGELLHAYTERAARPASTSSCSSAGAGTTATAAPTPTSGWRCRAPDPASLYLFLCIFTERGLHVRRPHRAEYSCPVQGVGAFSAGRGYRWGSMGESLLTLGFSGLVATRGRGGARLGRGRLSWASCARSS